MPVWATRAAQFFAAALEKQEASGLDEKGRKAVGVHR
jgi:hypothetical protein